MKNILLSTLLVFGFSAIAQTVSQTKIISYEQTIFDSDTCCWRKLSADKKYNEAAELVVQYLNNHKHISNKHALNWHAGQLFALAGQNDQAKRYFKKTYNVFYKIFGDADMKAWRLYAKGTIAFLEKDQPKLKKMISQWTFEQDKNFMTLEILLQKWNCTYQEALKN